MQGLFRSDTAVWQTANDIVAIWRGDAESIDVDIVMVWAPPPRSGRKPLRYKAVTALGLDPDDDSTHSGVICTGFVQDAAATWIVAVVGPVGNDEDTLMQCRQC